MILPSHHSAVRFIAVCLLVLTLTGCVAGQSLKYNDLPALGTPQVQSKGNMNLEVLDQRPYVLDGTKKNTYIGHYRAGFGNPWDVKTSSGNPFAEEMRQSLIRELLQVGFSSKNNPADSTLRVVILEWNMDTYINATLWYDLNVLILDPAGSIIHQQKIAKKQSIEGSFWTGAKSAVEKKAPEIFQQVIHQIVTDNKEHFAISR
ncbi:MAG: hypothetical protein HQM04_03465 [Magnetococcales bacterium]|nr:hypothetical protein [Magnetococcales bacterium]MBF0114082.1 hypothetical protein [Magnetococcales bacterium]